MDMWDNTPVWACEIVCICMGMCDSIQLYGHVGQLQLYGHVRLYVYVWAYVTVYGSSVVLSE